MQDDQGAGEFVGVGIGATGGDAASSSGRPTTAPPAIPGTSPSYRSAPDGTHCRYLTEDPAVNDPCWGPVGTDDEGDADGDPACRGHICCPDGGYIVEEHDWPGPRIGYQRTTYTTTRRHPLAIQFGDAGYEAWVLRQTIEGGGQGAGVEVELQHIESHGMPLHLDRELADVIGRMLVEFAETGRMEGPDA